MEDANPEHQRTIKTFKTVQMGAGIRHVNKQNPQPREIIDLGKTLKPKEGEEVRLTNLRIADRKAILEKCGDLTEQEKSVI